MSVVKELVTRADEKCELCGSKNDLDAYQVAPFNDQDAEHNVLTCSRCRELLDQ